MQSNYITDSPTDVPTQFRERLDAIVEAREVITVMRKRRRNNKKLAAQTFGMLQVREQSIGRTLPNNGRVRRPQTGRLQTPKWTVIFTQMLWPMLAGSLTREQHEQVIIATRNTQDHDEIVIDLQDEDGNNWQPAGAQKGRLSIVVNQGNPRHGFSSRASDESDWRGFMCRTARTPRIELAPHMEITHRILALDPQLRNLRFRDFLAWEHGVDLVSEVGKYKVYHADYNWTYPVLKIVSEVIKEHYLRRDMPGPDAPWDA
jgi:hypothetical protein